MQNDTILGFTNVSRVQHWQLLAVIMALAVTTVAFHARTLRSLDDAPTAPARAWAVYGNTIQWNDTDQFAEYLEASANALRTGRIYFPVSEYDCPISFLVPCGVIRIVTGWPPIRIMNLFTIVSTFLSGIAAYLLFRKFDARIGPAFVAAVGYQTANFTVYSHQQGHMQYIQFAWMPMAISALLTLLRQSSRWRPALWLGLVMGGLILTSPSWTLYLGYVALPVFALTYILAAHRSKIIAEVGRLLIRGGLAVAVTVVVAAFYLIPRMNNLPRHFPRPLSDVFAFVLYDPSLLVDSAHPMLFLGWPLIIVGIFAVVWWRQNRTPELNAVVATGLAAFVMMFPARFGMPYWLFWKFAPMGDHLRVPARFFPIFLIMLLTLISVYLSRRWASSWKPAACLFTALALGNWLASPWLIGFDLYAALDGVGRRLQSITGWNLGVT